MRQVEASMEAYESHCSIESNTYTQTHKDSHWCDDAQEFQMKSLVTSALAVCADGVK